MLVAYSRAAGAIEVHHPVFTAIPGRVQDGWTFRGNLAVCATKTRLADTHAIFADSLQT